MITKTYICDRCKKQSDSLGNSPKEFQLWDIELNYRSYGSGAFGIFTPLKAQWCRKCMVEMGLLERPKKEGAKQENFLSLENIIRDLIQEEISNSRS